MNAGDGKSEGLMKSSIQIILKIDVVEFSSRIEPDDIGTIHRIAQTLNDLRKRINDAGGFVHSSAGDSFLATFISVNETLQFAFCLQEGNYSEGDNQGLRFRIGIHAGEVYDTQGDIAGNSVNIAARLEALSPQGGICISRSVWDMSPRRYRERFSHVGEQRLKNITTPIEIFHFSPSAIRPASEVATPLIVSPSTSSAPAVLMHERPSILVRPLKVLSDESSDMFFAEGFNADLITRLSRFQRLDVIGRNTSVAITPGVSDLNAAGVAKARYVVTGHFQRVGNRMRLGVALTDPQMDKVVWAEIFDRSLDDFFEVQAAVAEAATVAMAVHIDKIEERLARARDPSDLDAYKLVVRGRLEDMEDGAVGREATERAMRYFSAAAERDEYYSAAVAGMARAASVQWRFGWCDDRIEKMVLARKFATTAVSIDNNDATSHAELGFVSLYNREHDRSIAAYERALELNPSDVDIIAFYADALKHSGKPGDAVPFFQRAIRLNPLHPDIYLGNLAHAHFVMEDYDSAIATIRRMRQQLTAQRVLTASLMLAGREEEGRQEAERLRAAFPNFSAAAWCKIVPDRLPEHSALLQEGLERAGF